MVPWTAGRASHMAGAASQAGRAVAASRWVDRRVDHRRVQWRCGRGSVRCQYHRSKYRRIGPVRHGRVGAHRTEANRFRPRPTSTHCCRAVLRGRHRTSGKRGERALFDNSAPLTLLPARDASAIFMRTRVSGHEAARTAIARTARGEEFRGRLPRSRTATRPNARAQLPQLRTEPAKRLL